MSAAAANSWGACLAAARVGLPRLEADVLTARALETTRSALYAFPERRASPDRFDLAQSFASRRRCGEPVAYIVGEREFWSLPLRVDARALIPRPETECLVAAALARLADGERALDLGTGCGAVALALASERPRATVVGVDASAPCVALAKENAERLRLQLALCVSDWYANVNGKFNVIVCNPPYLAASDPHLRQGDLRFEPRAALVAGTDALAALRAVIGGAPAHLAAGGWLLVEHGCEHGEAVRRLFANAGLRQVTTLADLAGLPRVTLGRSPRRSGLRRLRSTPRAPSATASAHAP